MGTTYGGYLDLIYDNVRQGRSVVNIIDGTGSGVSRPQSEIIWRDEDGERMPGL